MPDPEPLHFDILGKRAPTELERDEICAKCDRAYRDHWMPGYNWSHNAVFCRMGDRQQHFEATGRYAPVPPELAQLRALRKAEDTGWQPVWEAMRDQLDKVIGYRIANEGEMRRVAKRVEGR